MTVLFFLDQPFKEDRRSSRVALALWQTHSGITEKDHLCAQDSDGPQRKGHLLAIGRYCQRLFPRRHGSQSQGEFISPFEQSQGYRLKGRVAYRLLQMHL